MGRRAPRRTRLSHRLQPALEAGIQRPDITLFAMEPSMTTILKPGSVPLETLEKIYRDGLPVRIEPSFHAGIEKAAARIAEIAAGDAPVYGINTGFGKLASIRIAPGDVATLQ